MSPTSGAAVHPDQRGLQPAPDTQPAEEGGHGMTGRLVEGRNALADSPIERRSRGRSELAKVSALTPNPIRYCLSCRICCSPTCPTGLRSEKTASPSIYRSTARSPLVAGGSGPEKCQGGTSGGSTRMGPWDRRGPSSALTRAARWGGSILRWCGRTLRAWRWE